MDFDPQGRWVGSGSRHTTLTLCWTASWFRSRGNLCKVAHHLRLLGMHACMLSNAGHCLTSDFLVAVGNVCHMICAGDHSLVQGLKGDATYLVVTEKNEIEKFGINGKHLFSGMQEFCLPLQALLQMLQNLLATRHGSLDEGIERCSNVSLPGMPPGPCTEVIVWLRLVFVLTIFILLFCSCVHALGMRRALERGECSHLLGA